MGAAQWEVLNLVFDYSLVDERNVEFKKITANGNDLIYVSKNVVHTEDEHMDEYNLLNENEI